VSLATPAKLRRLQRALYATAKRDPARRFHVLYDKVWREDILAHAFALSRENGGAPGVHGVTFAEIETYGVARWLGELREEVRTGRYTSQPVRRVMIPKSGSVAQRPLGIPTIRDRVVRRSGGANRGEAGDRTDLRSGLRRGGVWIPPASERARGDSCHPQSCETGASSMQSGIELSSRDESKRPAEREPGASRARVVRAVSRKAADNRSYVKPGGPPVRPALRGPYYV
jgi:hypothetical protein